MTFLCAAVFPIYDRFKAITFDLFIVIVLYFCSIIDGAVVSQLLLTLQNFNALLKTHHENTSYN